MTRRRDRFRIEFDYTMRALLRPGTIPAFAGELPPRAFDAGGRIDCVYNALWMSGLSHLSYHDDESLAAELSRLGLNLVRVLRSGTTAAFVAAGSDFAVLAFQGTTRGIDELKIDLDARRVPLGDTGATVHSGFLGAFRSIETQVDAGLALVAGLPVWYTGHSLGGALALLAAAHRAPRSLVTFGAPRVGDTALAGVLGGVPTARFVNGCDVVPTLPPEMLGYRHVGEHWLLTSRPRIIRSPGQERVRDARRRARWPYMLRAWGHAGWVKSRGLVDHSILNYSAALSQTVDT